MAESDPALSRPLSVEQIVEIAQSFDYNPLIPLKYWLRTATTLLKEVKESLLPNLNLPTLTSTLPGRYI